MRNFLSMVMVVLGVRLMAAAEPETPKPAPRVIAVRVNLPLDDIRTNLPPLTADQGHPMKLGHPVLVTVSNLSTLIQDGRTKAKKIVLFVEGNELADVTPSGMSLERETLRFDLTRSTTNQAVWTPLLRNPVDPPFRPLLISVGLRGEPPLLVDEEARGALLQLIGWNATTKIWLGVFISLLLIFLCLAFGSDILRSPPNEEGGRGAYSLARVQAAFWLFLISMSFAFIWVVTSDLTALNTSALVLLGISGGTYVASGLLSKPPTPEQLDKGTKPVPTVAEANIALEAAIKNATEKWDLATKAQNERDTKQAAATADQNDLGNRFLAHLANSRYNTTLQAAEAAAEAQVAAEAAAQAAAQAPKPQVHERLATRFRQIPVLGQFLEDILTDTDGVTVHRFQMLVWTIVLGTVFVFSVAKDLVMPEFSATLLGLMGLSSATFLAPKLKTDK